ncbi:MAG: hypothetical protein EZS28_023052 [Streblomastix strix]|uniref:Uncharacterized protein n=1 Tax=Streblomastix strix TaxID=222440 RepID=A0A5J4VFP7_9EUKA|nr:MAG: hypothetical protein EZS28_023052 [Streblomastix strix]
MDNYSKQEYIGSQVINNILGMKLEHRINDAVNNQIDEEICDGNINQICTIETVGTISNREKRSKASWTNPIYKSSVHTGWASHHIHEPGIEQMSKQGRTGQNTLDQSNGNNECVSKEMGSNLINTGIGHIEDIRTMENENPNIEQKRNNSNLINTELFIANIAIQPFALPEDKDRQFSSMLQFNQIERQNRIEKNNRQDPLYIEKQQQEVKFRRIPGINNTEADSLLRLAISEDYSIDKQMLQQVLEETEIQISVDCLATRRNEKYHRYFSIESDSQAENWDGIGQSWECETPLLHCPISLIPAVIYKVELEQVKRELIAPIWEGYVWWTALMRIKIRQKELRDSQNVLKEET